MASIKPITRAIQVALAGSFILPGLALAQQAEPEAQTAEPVERIEVTGSRIKRTDFEGVAPVTVITAEDIDKSGFSSISELMQYAVANNGSSFDGDGSFVQGASTINLRGMGANRTLVLVNGRRQAAFPTAAGGTDNFVDISDIPSSAVERIEILTGGASAIYGSDAVGGVVNVILKKDYDGTKVSGRYENPTQGGRDVYKATFQKGFQTDNSNTLVIVEYKKQDELLTSDRDDLYSPGWYENEDGDQQWGAGPFGDASASSWGAYVYDRSRVYHDDKYNGASEEQCNALFGDKGIYQEWGKYDCYYDKYADRGLDNEYDRWNLVLNTTYDLNADWQLYGMLQASYKNDTKYKDEKGFGVYIYEDEDTGALSYERSDFDDYNQFQVRRRMEEYPGPRKYDITNEKYAFVFGAEGMIGDYELDVSWSSGFNKYESEKHHMVRADGLLDIITFDPNDPDASKWYPTDMLTTEQMDQLMGASTKDSDSELHQFQAIMTGDLMTLPHGELAFASTVEWAREEYTDGLDQVTIDGGFIGMGGTGGSGDRDRYAVAGEVIVPLLRDATGVHSLEFSAALRYDHYSDDSDVGGATTPQVGITYHPVENVLLRASWGESFRAPDMHRLYAGTTRSYTDRTFDHPSEPGEIYEDDYVSINSGSLELEEEEGEFWNIGMVANLTENLDVTVDWWEIELEGAVRTIDSDEIIKGNDYDNQYNMNGKYTRCEDMPGVGFLTEFDDDGIENVSCMSRKPINSAYESSEGVDFSINYSFPETSIGEFQLRMSASYLKEKLYQEKEGDPIEDYTETYYYPNWKGQASLSWDYQDFDASISYYYTGEADGEDIFEYPDGSEEMATDTLDAYERINISFAYSAPWDGRFKLGVNNVTDEMPPLYNEFNDAHNDWPFYKSSRGYSPVGRVVYFSYDQAF